MYVLQGNPAKGGRHHLTLRISRTLSLPLTAVVWVLAFLAKRGAGKTYCAADLAEEFLKHKIPIVVIDGMGIWWGLRKSADLKGDGLPVVVFGGEHADLELVPAKAVEIAHAVVQTNTSIVLDVSELSRAEARKTVAAFLDELWRINRADRHVFIEEADLWAPQKPYGIDQTTCLGAMDNFVRRGGNRNLGCTLITQRSAVLNKDVLTQSDCLVVLRTLAPQDKEAIQEWVEQKTDEDKRALKAWYDSLNSLDNGEAWVWHPEADRIFEKVKFRERETFHATREFIKTPQAANIKLMDVGEFVAQFRDLAKVQEQQKVDTETLTRRIRDLEARLRAAEARSGPSPEALKRMQDDAFERGARTADQRIKSIAERFDAYQREIDQFLQRVKSSLGRIETEESSIMALLPPDTSRLRGLFASPPRPENVPPLARAPHGMAPVIERSDVPGTQPPTLESFSPSADEPVNAGQMRILTVAAQLYPSPATVGRIAALAKYSTRGGTFQQNFKDLARRGLLSRQGDGTFLITDPGLNKVGSFEPLPTEREALLEAWASKFGSGGRILKAIAGRRGSWVPLSEVALEVRMTHTGGAFAGYIGDFRRAGLVEKQKIDGVDQARTTEVLNP